MLLKTILRPMFPLFLPVVCCRLQDSHIVVDRTGLWVSDDNAVFQKSGRPHFIRCDNGLMYG